MSFFKIVILQFSILPIFADTIAFVSLSMPKNSLKQWMHQASRYQIPIIIRGVLPQGLPATIAMITQLIDKSEGISIDPLSFRRFGITRVPALVRVRKGCCLTNQHCSEQDFSVVYGNISIDDGLKQLNNHEKREIK